MRSFVVFALAAACAATPTAATAQTQLSRETRQKLTDALNKGAAYLKSQQKPDGTWENHEGVTGMAATALLKNPAMSKADAHAATAKTIAYLRGLAKPDGGIYVKNIPHYITAVSSMTLVANGDPKDKATIEKARKYLVDHLLDEGEGLSPNDKFYGGLGWGGLSDGGRADIISMEYGLRAMKEDGTAPNDPAWDKAIKFLQRTQNAGELNDQGWANEDGGFVYYPGFSTAGGTRSYGSATYAGLMSYTWANLKKDDRRVQSVMKWIRDNYTVDENPGLGQKTVYYYYMVFAKALQAVGENTITDAKGVQHNWREDLAKKLISLQHPEGYWVNPVPDEMQDNKVLVTTFTMMAIEAILQ
ncbi:MAG TPA: prenyltransferase/squalene oxidase repeat-containing protein [Vicinamibacterales bacterium]|nr:prenyltransferase/squalene oxidase repeat-containing protein [Vicinamibacterales bacterium]